MNDLILFPCSFLDFVFIRWDSIKGHVFVIGWEGQRGKGWSPNGTYMVGFEHFLAFIFLVLMILVVVLGHKGRDFRFFLLWVAAYARMASCGCHSDENVVRVKRIPVWDISLSMALRWNISGGSNKNPSLFLMFP